MTAPARSPRLVALAALVLLAHAVLLEPLAPLRLRMPDPRAVKTLLVRTVAAQPASTDAPAVSTPPSEAAGVASATPKHTPKAPPAKLARGRAPATTPPVQRQAAADVQPSPPPSPSPLPSPQPARPHETTAPSFAVAVPPPMMLRYDVSVSSRGQRRTAQGELSWTHDGQTYDARLQITAASFPTRTQTSTGQLTREGLAPERFSDKSRSEQATHFVRDGGKVVFSANVPQAELQPGAQDRLSVMLQLAALMAGDPSRYRSGTAMTLQTAGTRDATSWAFTVGAAESLQLPGGEVSAVKLTRVAQGEYDQTVELWLAPGMAYAPVRWRLTNSNGDWVDQQWSGTDRP